MSAADVANECLAHGFFDGAELRDVVRSELPLRLMYELREAGVQRWEVEALSLAVRESADASALDVTAALTAEQTKALQSVRAEASIPADFRHLLEAVEHRLTTQRDLAAFYGVLRATLDKWDRVQSVRERDPSAA